MLQLYAQNQLTGTRQVPCQSRDHSTTDMVLAVNGLPVATIELLVQRMTENDKIVIRYMDDGEFQQTEFSILAKDIFEAVHARQRACPWSVSATVSGLECNRSTHSTSICLPCRFQAFTVMRK